MMEESVVIRTNMHSYFEPQVVRDNALKWSRWLTLSVISTRLFKVVLVFVLLLQFIVVSMTIAHGIRAFSSDFLTQYIEVLFPTISALLFNFVLLNVTPKLKYIESECWKIFWSHTSTTRRTELRSKSVVNYTNIVIALNTCLGIMGGFALFPIGAEKDFHFYLIYIKKFSSLLQNVLKAPYYFTLPFSGYVIVTLSHLGTQLVSHWKIQVYMLLDQFRYLTADFEHEEDAFLMTCKDYQKLVRQRLKFLIQRHYELSQLISHFTEISSNMIPIGVAAVFTHALSMVSYMFLGTYFGWWCYLQDLVWFSAGGLTAILFLNMGQDLEEESSKFFFASYNLRWTSFNQSNKQTLLSFMTFLQEPVALRFTQQVSVNNIFCLKLVQTLYSYAAIMANMRNVFSK